MKIKIVFLFGLLLSVGIPVVWCGNPDASLACDRPELLQVISVDDSTALVTWSDVGDEYELEVVLDTVGFSGTPTHLSLTDPPYLIDGLTPGLKYRFAVRAVCPDQSRSAWSIPRSFSTALNDERPCPVALPIQDTSCVRIPVYIRNAPGISLGMDVLLNEVRIVLEHEWRSDLDLVLESPDGTRIRLGNGFNAGDQHLGDPHGGDCSPSFVFTDENYALPLDSIDGVDAPVGYFLSIDPIASLHTGQNPNGLWYLEVCDDKLDDAGVLRSFGLVFSSTGCERPDSTWVSDVTENSVQVNWSPLFPGDLYVIEYGPAGFFPGAGANAGVGGSTTVNTVGVDSVMLSGLAALSSYEVYVRRRCANGRWSANSRATAFFTNCLSTLSETFDTLSLCTAGCPDPCPVSSVWSNVPVGDDYEWKVWSGPGLAWPGAGPPAGAGGSGNYLYFRNSCSFSGANGKTALVRSACIDVEAPADAACHFSFDLYMHTDIGLMGRLDLQVSADGGNNWTTIRSWTGSQEKAWRREYIRLDAYHQQAVQLQFVGTGALGAYGDIALDNLNFYGSQLIGNPNFVFFRDVDGDGWGNESVSISTCGATAPPGFVAQAGDCNDQNPNINPGAVELPCNGIDENCNGNMDDAVPKAPVLTGDTVCRGATALLRAVSAPIGEVYWYAQPMGGQALAVGDSFAVAPGQSQVFYVLDSIQGLCSSPRAAVGVEVLESTGLAGPAAASICLGDSLDLRQLGIVDTLNAPGAIDFYQSIPPTLQGLLASAVVAPDSDTVFYAVKILSNGCSSFLPVAIQVNELPELTLSAPGPVNVCPGKTETVTASGAGGLAPYAFEWSNGLTLPELEIYAMPGATQNFSITLTDAAGCRDTGQVSAVTDSGVSQAELVQVLPATVCGGTDGAIVLRPLNGQPPYTFSWSGPTPGTISGASAGETILPNLTPGAYRITVSDASGTGCNLTLPQIVVDAPGFTVSIDTIVHPACSGFPDGSIALLVQGSAPQITWSDGQDGPLASQLTAGSYSVTVTVGGCSQVLEDIILEDPPALEAFANKIDPAGCFGGTDGAVDIVVSGGLPPYVFDWSNGQQTEDLDQLPAGVYSVTIEDQNGCTADLDSMIVTGPAQPMLGAMETVKAISCHNTTDGRLRATVQGGTPPYAFEWNTGANTSELFGLGAGSYQVTVHDAFDCTISIATALTAPDSLELNVQISQLTCLGAANGSVEASASGGTPPYGFQWNTGEQTSSIANLNAGQYQVEAIDANGCRLRSDTIPLVAQQALTVVLDTLSDVNCFGVADGLIAVSVAGGTAPIQYRWNGVAGGPELSTSVGGAYLLEVRDANNCAAQDTFMLQGPSEALSLELVQLSDVFCAGEPSGDIRLNTLGGTAPYHWMWNTGQATEDISGLFAGTYDVTATDANGCATFLGSLEVAEPDSILVQMVKNDIPCFGPQFGSITLEVTGGVPPYGYSWSNGGTQSGIFMLTSGLYDVTVSDATGCAMVLEGLEVVDKKQAFAANIMSVRPVDCNEAGNGSVVVSVDNGTPPFQFAWSSPIGLHPNVLVPTDTADMLAGGVYQVQVTDANGCATLSDSIVIEEAPRIGVGFNGLFSLKCKGDSTGFLEPLVNGGVPPYDFVWSTSDSSAVVSNLPAGAYSLTITDQQACSVVAGPLVINEPGEALAITTQSVVDDDCALGLGSVTISGSGGAQPYYYIWSNGSTRSKADSLVAGNYTLTMTDALGCTKVSDVFTVNGPGEPLQLGLLSIVQPNCPNDSTGSIFISTTGGTMPYSYFWDNGGNTAELSGIPSGLYTVTVTDGLGCSVADEFPLDGPGAFEVSWEVDSLPGGWSVELSVSGGTPGYLIEWDALAGGQTGPIASGLLPGFYGATVTDQQGCVYVVEGIPVGISSSVLDIYRERWQLYPNPATGHVVFSRYGSNSRVELEAIDMNGRHGKTWSIPETHTGILDLSGLIPGSYMLVGRQGGQSWYIGRLVVLRP